MPHQLPQLLDLQLIQLELPLLLLEYQQLPLLLHLLLRVFAIDGLHLLLPQFLGLSALLLELGDLLLEFEDHLWGNGLDCLTVLGLLLVLVEFLLELLYPLLLLDELLVVLAQDSLGFDYLLVHHSGLLLHFYQLLLQVLQLLLVLLLFADWLKLLVAFLLDCRKGLLL